MAELEEASKNNDGLNFQIAINYGSRDEMVRAMKKMAADRDAGKLSAADISEETFAQYLDTAGIPDPDLLIRTSGEQRLSNYLLVAAGLFGVLFYRYSLAGFFQRGA